MKTVVVIFIVCFAAVFANKLTEEQKEMLKPYKEECLKETGVNEAILEATKNSATPDIEFDKKVTCFSACMFKKIGFTNEEGKLEEDITRAFLSGQLPDDILNAAIDNCKDEVGKDECETAGKLIKCFMKNKAVISA